MTAPVNVVNLTPDLERIIRENERMRTSLLNIRAYTSNAVFGLWRRDVDRIAANGLTPVSINR